MPVGARSPSPVQIFSSCAPNHIIGLLLTLMLLPVAGTLSVIRYWPSIQFIYSYFGVMHIPAPFRRRQFLSVAGVIFTTAALTRSAGPFAAHAKLAQSQAGFHEDVVAARRRPLPLHQLDPKLLRQALAALDRHGNSIRHRDRMAIVDFSAPSSVPRFHFLDIVNGEATPMLVAHGSGSDPEHTGYLHRFSNAFDSNASSEGAFVTADYYVGKHGRSQRLLGLDPTNDNAHERAIVIHGAWYANADMIPLHGKLGRSQGCFAVGEQELDKIFDYLGEGRLIYASKA